MSVDSVLNTSLAGEVTVVTQCLVTSAGSVLRATQARLKMLKVSKKIHFGEYICKHKITKNWIKIKFVFTKKLDLFGLWLNF